MADKPSRALVIYGDGFAPLISSSHSHLHSLATQASCGFLSLRQSPPLSESMDDARIMEVAQLLDTYEVYIAKKGEHPDNDLDFGKDQKMQTLSDRFMGLKAGIFSTCSSVESFGRSLGFSVLQFAELIKNDKQEVLDVVSIASELLRLLGFSGGVVVEKGDFDLLFVHVGATEKENDMKDGVPNIDIEWINSLVGGLMQIAQPGSVLASRLHLSVVMSYGVAAKDEDDGSSTLVSVNETDSHLPLLYPQQSYTRKGGKLLNDIRHHHPMLVAQWQEAVTRKDLAQTFSFNEFKEGLQLEEVILTDSVDSYRPVVCMAMKGCNLAIPAERFFHELAFKLWKAPKYGA